jgi:hypothetical protein
MFAGVLFRFRVMVVGGSNRRIRVPPPSPGDIPGAAR